MCALCGKLAATAFHLHFLSVPFCLVTSLALLVFKAYLSLQLRIWEPNPNSICSLIFAFSDSLAAVASQMHGITKSCLKTPH